MKSKLQALLAGAVLLVPAIVNGQYSINWYSIDGGGGIRFCDGGRFKCARRGRKDRKQRDRNEDPHGAGGRQEGHHGQYSARSCGECA